MIVLCGLFWPVNAKKAGLCFEGKCAKTQAGRVQINSADNSIYQGESRALNQYLLFDFMRIALSVHQERFHNCGTARRNGQAAVLTGIFQCQRRFSDRSLTGIYNLGAW